jgi:hypothetical protein
MNSHKRQSDDKDLLPFTKRAVTKATVQENVYTVVCNRATRVDSTGKIFLSAGTHRCADARVSNLNTFVRFPQPSAASAVFDESGLHPLLSLPSLQCSRILNFFFFSTGSGTYRISNVTLTKAPDAFLKTNEVNLSTLWTFEATENTTLEFISNDVDYSPSGNVRFCTRVSVSLSCSPLSHLPCCVPIAAQV